MSISEICNHNVISVDREATVVEAAALMRKHHVGDVVVTEDNDGRRTPVGVVTDRDLVVEVMASGLDSALVKVGDLLLRPLVSIEGDASHAQVVRLMAVEGVRRMPVVSKSGDLIGMVTLDDMLWSIARVRSAKDLDAGGRQAVLKHLRNCGFTDHSPKAGAERYKRGTPAALIRWLWTDLANKGIVQDRSDRALRRYIARHAGLGNPKGVDEIAPQHLDRADANQVIEQLKGWLVSRTGELPNDGARLP